MASVLEIEERYGKMDTSILLVDDEEIIRKSLVRELKLENFAVTAVADGSEAISVLENEQFDLVITDLMMPGVDGFAVLKAVKLYAPQAGVIIFTGYGDMSTAIDALRLGADDFALKPCGMGELLFRIERCLAKRKLQQQFLQARELEAIGQLAAYIAHEINTPLQYVQGNVSFIERSWTDLHDLLVKIKKTEHSCPATAKIAAIMETINLDLLLNEMPECFEETHDGINRVAKIVAAMRELSLPGGS